MSTATSSVPHIIDIDDGKGGIAAPEWLARSEKVHRELRPQIPAEYAAAMLRVFAGGARMCVVAREERVLGVAVYRVYENTFAGLQMYVDDLVTTESERSSGVGKMLMDDLQRRAREMGCKSYDLDSGTQREQAHKFYFREGMVISAFHFSKPVAR
jgi:GNAT superfamily N-acetyltransferase